MRHDQRATVIGDDRKRRLGEVRDLESIERVEREIESHRHQASLCEAALQGVETRIWKEVLKPELDNQLAAFNTDVWEPTNIEHGDDFVIRRAIALFAKGLRDAVEGRADESLRDKHLKRARELADELQRYGVPVAPVAEGAQ